MSTLKEFIAVQTEQTLASVIATIIPAHRAQFYALVEQTLRQIPNGQGEKILAVIFPIYDETTRQLGKVVGQIPMQAVGGQFQQQAAQVNGIPDGSVATEAEIQPGMCGFQFGSKDCTQNGFCSAQATTMNKKGQGACCAKHKNRGSRLLGGKKSNSGRRSVVNSVKLTGAQGFVPYGGTTGSNLKQLSGLVGGQPPPGLGGQSYGLVGAPQPTPQQGLGQQTQAGIQGQFGLGQTQAPQQNTGLGQGQFGLTGFGQQAPAQTFGQAPQQNTGLGQGQFGLGQAPPQNTGLGQGQFGQAGVPSPQANANAIAQASHTQVSQQLVNDVSQQAAGIPITAGAGQAVGVDINTLMQAKTAPAQNVGGGFNLDVALQQQLGQAPQQTPTQAPQQSLGGLGQAPPQNTGLGQGQFELGQTPTQAPQQTPAAALATTTPDLSALAVESDDIDEKPHAGRLVTAARTQAPQQTMAPQQTQAPQQDANQAMLAALVNEAN